MRADVQLESSYDSTRLDANRQQVLNIYPHTLRGYRQVPGYVTFADFLSTGEPLIDVNASAITDADGDPVNVSITPGGSRQGHYCRRSQPVDVSGHWLISLLD